MGSARCLLWMRLSSESLRLLIAFLQVRNQKAYVQLASLSCADVTFQAVKTGEIQNQGSLMRRAPP